MVINQANLNDFIADKIKALKCREDTKAYVTSIFDKYKFANFDYSKESITILYKNAQSKQNFASFQNLADWLFLCETMFPQHLNNASEEYYQTIARLSYNSCYNLIQRRWILFDELAQNYVYIVSDTRKILKSNYNHQKIQS